MRRPRTRWPSIRSKWTLRNPSETVIRLRMADAIRTSMQRTADTHVTDRVPTTTVEEASAMAGPRFVFLSRPTTNQHGDTVGEDVTWMIVSPNSRPLGRSAVWFADYDECRKAALPLRERAGEMRIIISVSGGQWLWRGDLAGTPIAISTRSYLRQHECDYNSHRFLEALPMAQIVAGVRVVGRGTTAR